MNPAREAGKITQPFEEKITFLMRSSIAGGVNKSQSIPKDAVDRKRTASSSHSYLSSSDDGGGQSMLGGRLLKLSL